LKQNKSPFKWRHFEPTIILLCVRWYCRYQLSYRDLEEMMRERGLAVDHTTVWRWVQRYAPEINKRMRPHSKMSGTSYRLDETYVKVGTDWKYLYRAVDSAGDTITSGAFSQELCCSHVWLSAAYFNSGDPFLRRLSRYATSR
jgi:transposase-like protein